MASKALRAVRAKPRPHKREEEDAVVESQGRIRCRLCERGSLRLYMCGPRLRGRCRSCGTVFVFLWSQVRQGWYRWDGREWC